MSSWQAAREVRPIPTELRSLPIVRGFNIALYGAIAVFLLSLAVVVVEQQVAHRDLDGIYAIIAVSLVVLTGWAGQVSLGQMAFAAIGGAVGGWVTQNTGWDLGFALLAAGVAGAIVAVVIGIPAARAGGLTLAVTTLALAPAVAVLAPQSRVLRLAPARPLRQRPRRCSATIEIKSQMSFYFLTLAVLAFAIAIAYGIRRSRTGRVLDRAPREPARRGGVRHQRAADDARPGSRSRASSPASPACCSCTTST